MNLRALAAELAWLDRELAGRFGLSKIDPLRMQVSQLETLVQEVARQIEQLFKGV